MFKFFAKNIGLLVFFLTDLKGPLQSRRISPLRSVLLTFFLFVLFVATLILTVFAIENSFHAV